MFKKGLFGLLVVSILIVAGCSDQKVSKVSDVMDPEGVLKLRLKAEPSYLNPILYTDAYSGSVVGLIFSGLFRVDENLELQPDLCERYEVSKDGLVYTFYLRKNVFWHDGKRLTADDVKFTFDLLLDPKTQTVRRSSYIINGKPIRFRALDSFTFQAKLPEPFAPFLSRISTGILPRHILMDDDINTTSFNRNPVGSGPFKFVEWKSGQYVKLVRNDNYYGAKPKLKEILMKIIPDDNTAKVALEKGEIDESGILPKDFYRISKWTNVSTYRYKEMSYSFMAFNLRIAKFRNPLIRQAVVHAVNRSALVKNVLKGFGAPAYLPSSPVSWAYPDELNITKYDYDPEKSKSLLRQAGFEFDTESGYFIKNGKPCAFTLITSKGNLTGEKMAQYIQQYLKAVGIKLELELMEWQSFLKILDAPKDPKEFDAAMLSWSLGLDPDAYTIWHSSQYPDGFNFIGYSNSEVNQLLVEGRRTLNRKDRKRIYNKLFKTIGEDAPYMFLTYSESLQAVNNRVRGLSKPGPSGLFTPIENVYVVE